MSSTTLNDPVKFFIAITAHNSRSFVLDGPDVVMNDVMHDGAECENLGIKIPSSLEPGVYLITAYMIRDEFNSVTGYQVMFITPQFKLDRSLLSPDLMGEEIKESEESIEKLSESTYTSTIQYNTNVLMHTMTVPIQGFHTWWMPNSTTTGEWWPDLLLKK